MSTSATGPAGSLHPSSTLLRLSIQPCSSAPQAWNPSDLAALLHISLFICLDESSTLWTLCWGQLWLPCCSAQPVLHMSSHTLWPTLLCFVHKHLFVFICFCPVTKVWWYILKFILQYLIKMCDNRKENTEHLLMSGIYKCR